MSPTTDFTNDDRIATLLLALCKRRESTRSMPVVTDGRRPTQTSRGGMRILTSIFRGSADFPPTCSRCVVPSFPRGGACCLACSGGRRFARPTTSVDYRQTTAERYRSVTPEGSVVHNERDGAGERTTSMSKHD